MIIYGIKAKALASETIMDSCPSCGKINTVTLHVIQKYLHVFFIPFVPAGKKVVSECSHCKQVLTKKQMPLSFNAGHYLSQGNMKPPVWMFSGAALVAVLIAWGVYDNKQTEAKNAVWIKSPQRGDVYDIKTSESQYTVYKVEEIEKDSVVIRPSNFEVNKLTALGQITSKGDSAWSDDVFAFSKAEIEKMFTSHEIIDIHRK